MLKNCKLYSWFYVIGAEYNGDGFTLLRNAIKALAWVNRFILMQISYHNETVIKSKSNIQDTRGIEIIPIIFFYWI